MSDDSETEIDPEDIIAGIEDEERCDDARQPMVDEFVDALTALEGDFDVVLASDEADTRSADRVLDGLTDRQSEFLTEIEKLDDRYAPYRDELATWIEYDAPDSNDDERWPFALDEDEEEESDEN
jgi:hypothetical protein